MATFKLQSAMEYLMTYGWALLIISVVIIALVSIGVFNGGLLGNQCTTAPGYTCDIQSFSASTGNVVVTIGQDSGTPWTSAQILFINSSAESAAQAGLTPAMLAASNTLSNGLPSSTTITVSVPVFAPGSARVGQSITGYLWAEYTIGGQTGSVTQVEMATVTAKATS